MKGFVLWFTGLSGSGKSTLSTLVGRELSRLGIHVETLDGDEIRKTLSHGLGFDKEGRDANIRRLGFVAKLVARSGGCAIAAAISPYRAVRDEVRGSTEHFCEVYCECPLDVLTLRDPKGLYRRALAGDLLQFTGVDAPYEAPLHAEVHLRTDLEGPAESVAKIMAKLAELGFIAAGPQAGRSQLGAYGRERVQRVLVGEAAAVARAELAQSPTIELDLTSERSAWCLASGYLAPLRGFFDQNDYQTVSREMRLQSGLYWPVPLLLGVPASARRALEQVNRAALTRAGQIVGQLERLSVWQNPLSGAIQAAGDVTMFQGAAADPHFEPASAVAASFSAKGLTKVVAVTAVGQLARLEHPARAALELHDALAWLVPAGADEPRSWLKRMGEVSSYCNQRFSRQRSFAFAVPSPFQLPEPAQVLLELIVARNLGATHALVPRFGASGAKLVESLPGPALESIGLSLLPYEPWAWHEQLKTFASAHSLPGETPGSEDANE